ncbi:MAG: hypothetical protein PVF89_01925 [Lysobacterales bacterium]
MKLRHPARLALALLSGWLFATSSPAAESGKPARLFARADSAEWSITLSGPWREIRRHVKKDARYPARLTYPGADGVPQTISVEVSPRGLTRRLEVCSFPPLKVHFNKQETKNTAWRGNGSLKLVTYCRTNQKYSQYYIKEFLAYRIYNLITPFSFRVKPLMVEYVDDEKKSRTLTRFGFLIEDIDDVAQRLDLKDLHIGKVAVMQLDPLETARFALFQYMISNLDWSALSGPDPNRCCHNSRLIGKSETAVPKYAIPYDFDFSGLVNAPYAGPPEGIRVRNVRQRLYRGFCADNDRLPQAVADLNQKRRAIMALINDNPHLDKRARQSALDYLQAFYEIINDPDQFERQITGKCRGQAAEREP